MMKRSFSLLLVLTLILSSFGLVASAATGASQVISEFNIMPQSCSADSDNLVTRGEFAFTIANILGSGEAAPRATDFIDVGEDIEDSGYIYYATINGFLLPDGNMFCPNDPISLHDFNDAVIKLLAYETIAQSNGGGVDGAMKTVRDLKIYNDVVINNYDSVTVKQYRQLIYNLMTASVADFNYSYDQNGNINLYRTGSTKTVLSQYFGISRYYGSIIEVNNDKPSVKFNVTKNVSESNPVYLAAGSDYYFLSNGKVDLNFYKNIPVEIWTNQDDTIVYIAPQTNVEVFYDVIYSVNNDTDSTIPYTLSMVDEIELSRDTKEYKIASGAQMSFNGEIMRSAPLAGHYAKIVLIDNKINFIETWELTEGGIVTDVTNSYITYYKGEAEGRLKKISEYDDITVIIDGRSTDRTQIKLNSLLSYYQTENKLVIVVSEKTIVGNLDSIGTDELEIGRNFYPIHNDGDVYVSEDGEIYKTNRLDGIFGQQIICYVDIFGNIRYIKALGDLNANNEFTAYVLGSSRKAFEGTKVKVQKIYPAVEEAIYVLPENFTNYVDNPATPASEVDAAYLQTNFLLPMTWDNRSTAYKKIYKITVNDKDEITEITEPDYFLLFGEEHVPQQVQADGTVAPAATAIPVVPVINAYIDGFPNDGYTRVGLALTGSEPLYNGLPTSYVFAQYYYNHGEPFVALVKDGNNVKPVMTNFSEMRSLGTYSNSGFAITDMKIAMLGGADDSIPYLWLLYGETDRISMYNGRSTSTVESVTQKYDVEEDRVYYEVVLGNGKDVWKLDSVTFTDNPTWTISSSDGSSVSATRLEAGMKVEYVSDAVFNDNEVYIRGVIVYPEVPEGTSMTMDEWLSRNANGYLVGTLKKLTDYRLFLDDGSAYHLANSCGIVGIKRSIGKVEEISLTEAEVPVGATVYFNRNFSVSTIYVDITEE